MLQGSFQVISVTTGREPNYAGQVCWARNQMVVHNGQVFAAAQDMAEGFWCAVLQQLEHRALGILWCVRPKSPIRSVPKRALKMKVLYQSSYYDWV